MSQPLVTLDLTEAAALREPLTTRQWATLLGVTPRALQLQLQGLTPALVEDAPRWTLGQLPDRHQATLTDLRRATHCRQFADLFKFKTAWTPPRHFKEFSAYNQEKAPKVQRVMQVYFAALDAPEGTERAANCAARSAWLAEFGAAVSEKTIRNWAAKIEARGGIVLAPIEAFCEEKSCPHTGRRLENRLPGELIRNFKALCLREDMTISSAHRALEILWQNGDEVPGLGKRPDGAPAQLPFTCAQLRKFAPSRAAMLHNGRSKAAAKALAMPHMRRDTTTLRRGELLVLDDSRLNVTCLSDVTGKPVVMTAYMIMDVATRQVLGYSVVEAGAIRQADVQALLSRTLRTLGLPHRDAGYACHILFERGTVACSESYQVLLEQILFKGLLQIHRTSMNGGTSTIAGFKQASSGNWMGKGWIESFMRTLGLLTRHLPGQMGSVYAKTPAALQDRQNEAALYQQAARVLAFVNSGGQDSAPHAKDAAEAAGFNLPLMHVSTFMGELAKTVAWYNRNTDHRREGYLDIEEHKLNGGLGTRRESATEKARRLELDLEHAGTPMQRIAPQDAAAMLTKTRSVKVTPRGAELKIHGKIHRFWHPDSLTCHQAQNNATLSKDYIALVDEDMPTEIFLLKNPAGSFKEGDTTLFLEHLPLVTDPKALDNAALAKAGAQLHQVSRRIATEVANGEAASMLEERLPQIEDNYRALTRVVTTVNGDQRNTAPASETMRLVQRLKGQAAQSEPQATPRRVMRRMEQQQAAAPKLDKSLEALRLQAEQEEGAAS